MFILSFCLNKDARRNKEKTCPSVLLSQKISAPFSGFRAKTTLNFQFSTFNFQFTHQTLQTMLTTVLLLIIIEYTGVLLAIIADLASGLRKARAKRIPRTSRALRRTVDKIARYFNALFALTILDGMIIAGIVYLRTTNVATFPIIPIFSMLGAIALTIIEIKSICEKAEDKGDLSQAANTIKELLESPSFKTIIKQLQNNSTNN